MQGLCNETWVLLRCPFLLGPPAPLTSKLLGFGLGVVADVAQALAVGHRVGSAFGVRDDVIGNGRSSGTASTTDRVSSQDGAAHGGREGVTVARPRRVHLRRSRTSSTTISTTTKKPPPT